MSGQFAFDALLEAFRRFPIMPRKSSFSRNDCREGFAGHGVTSENDSKARTSAALLRFQPCQPPFKCHVRP